MLQQDQHFDKLSTIVEKRINRPIMEWLSFHSLFKTGKQGITGVLVDKNKNKFAFKVSQYINYLAEHEFKIMDRLNSIQRFCPNFCRSFCIIECEMEPKCKPDSNPFELSSKYPVHRNVLLEEMIDGLKLCKHIKNNTNIEVIFSAIKQSLLGVHLAQKHCNFTHYDLHSDNIILRKCNYDTVFLYVTDADKAVAVPTLGYCSSIIDFGFSYIDASDSSPFTSTLAHTSDGYMCDRFNPLADAKVLLISISEELRDYRQGSEVTTFSNVVKNIFSNLNVHWDCGWDDHDCEGASYILIDKVQKKSQVKSKMFKKYGDYCMDILFSMIVLPLQENKTTDLQLSYEIFVKEFSKIEEEIQSSVYNLYILKCIVDNARLVEEMYLQDDTRLEAISIFRDNVIDAIHKVSKYCSPKKVHYERMICSLYSFADCSSGYLHKIVNEQAQEKQKYYDKMPIQSTLEIVDVLNTNIEDTYKYNPKTEVVIFDSINNSRCVMSLSPEEIQMMNELPPYMKGLALLELFRQGESAGGDDLSDESDIAKSNVDDDE